MDEEVTPERKNSYREKSEERKKDGDKGRRSNRSENTESDHAGSWDEDLSAGPKE